MRLALVTSTRERCGIAAYSRALAAALSPRLDLDVVPIDPQPLGADAIARLNAADLVHLQHEYSFWGSALPGRSRLPRLLAALKRPHVMTAHTVAPAAAVLDVVATGGWRGTLKGAGLRLPAVRHFVEVAPFESAAAVIVHSAAAQSTLIDRGLSPGALYFLPMPCPVPVEPSDPAAALAGLGLDGRRYMLCFGYLSAAKGYEAALSAFAGLAYDGLLVLAGAPCDAAGELYLHCLRIQARALGVADRVLFPGFVDDPTLTALLRGADLVLLPYRGGTGSYALSLALACGAAVLASDLPVFADAPVARAATGPEAFRATMQRLLDDGEERTRLHSAALEWAAQHNWESAAAEHLRIYERVYSDSAVPATSTPSPPRRPPIPR